MPKAVGRASQRKRKANKPTEENYASSSKSNVKLIKVLKGKLSNAHLDDCNNDFAEFQSSRAPARKKRRQNPEGEEITRKGVTSPVKTISVVEKNVTGEDKEQSNQEKHSKQSVRSSPRIKGKSNVGRGRSKTEDVSEVKDGKKISKQGIKKQGRVGNGAKEERKETEPVSFKKVSETESKGLESSQGEKEELKNHGVGLKDLTGGGTGEELVSCPCCGRTAPEIYPDGQGDMNNHALVCLHQKFGSSAGESNKPGNFSGKDSKMLEKEEVTKCQICNRVIDHMSTRKRTEHVNRCIDSATQSHANGKSSTKQSLHLDYNGSTTTDDEDEVVCQICHKNISHMNSRRRTQHVNRCIDSTFEEMKTTTPPSQDQPEQEPDVPSCVICGTSLNTYQKRKSHLKKCARENNISTLQLLDMVKKQELSSRDKPVSIEKPLSGQQQESIKPREAFSTGPATKAHKPRKKKKDDLDEDVQVAMAISASIAEQEEKEKRNLGITNENPPGMLDTASSKAEGVKKKKKGRGRPAKHKTLNFPVLLTRTSPENRKMWSEKIGALVEASLQQQRNVGKTPQNEKSELAKMYSKSAGEWEVIGQAHEGQDQDKTTKPIWQLSRCDALLGNTPFYVNTLRPYVTPPKASKPRTKRLRFEQSPHSEAVPEADKSDPFSPADDRIHGAITQETVDALMGLAMEDEEDTSRRSLSPSASGFIRSKLDTSDDEVPVEATDDITQEQYQLLASLRDLVDSPLLNPLTIKTKDGQKIHAHRFMLQLRCPALVKDASYGGKETLPDTIHLQDFTKLELLSVMSYLYAGDISFQDSDVPQIEKFAERYDLKELQDICSKRQSKSHGRIVTPSKGEEQEKDIQDLIQSIWDDKNEQEVSSQTGETSSESLDDPPNLADLTEIYEVAISQKSRYVDESSSSDDDDSSDNNNRLDKMNEKVDNKKDNNGDRDADGEGGADDVSRDGSKTDREGRLQNGRQDSVCRETGRTVKERGGKEGESCEDVVRDGDEGSRGEDEKRRSVSGNDELFRRMEGGKGGLENGGRERADHMHNGDNTGEAQSNEMMKDAAVRGSSEESLPGSAEEEEVAKITSEAMDSHTSAEKTRKGNRTGLRKDGGEGEETDRGYTVDEDELAVKSHSNMMAKRSDRRQSVERMDNGRSSAESLNEDDGTQTDSTMEVTPIQRRKKRERLRKTVSQNGKSSPSVEKGLLSKDIQGSLARKGTLVDLIAGEKKEGLPVFTPRKRGRPPKIPTGRKGEGQVSTSSESGGIDKAVVLSPLEETNQASSSKKDGQRVTNFSQKEDLPLVITPRKRGRPRKYKVIEKEKISRTTTSSESETLDKPKLPPSVEVSSPQSSQVSRELPPGFTPRKSERAQKNRSVKKKVETKTNLESKSWDRAVSSPLSQVSTLSRSASDTDAYSVENEWENLTPSGRKCGKTKKNSVNNTRVGKMESSESDHLNLSQGKVSLKNSENCKGSQEERSESLAKDNSFQVLKRKRGRPRKSEGLLKGAKKDDPRSRGSDGSLTGDREIGKGEKRTSESPSAKGSSTLFPYILQERRWSLRSPQSQEVEEKEKSPFGNNKSPLTKKKKKSTPVSTPVRKPFTKLATKKKSFKFKRIRTPLPHSKQKNDKNVMGKNKASGSSLVKKRKSTDGLSRSDTKSPKNVSSEKSSTATEIAEMVNGNEQSESSKDDHSDVSAALFNEDVSEVEGTPEGVEEKISKDFSVIAKPGNDFFSENYKVSDKLKFAASTPNYYLKYKDTISPLKVNLGRKVAVLHMRSVNSSGGEIELIQDMNTLKGKENVPELTDGDHLSPVGVDKTLNFDDNDGDGEDDIISPVVSPSPIHLSPSRVPETNSPASSPVFNYSLAHQEHKTMKRISQKSVEESGEEIVRKDEKSELEEMETNSPLRKETPDVSPCKSLNGSMSFSEGLCIGRGNDEELVSRSLSSQPIVSLSRRIPGSPVDIREKEKEGFPAETDKKDVLKGSEGVGEDRANSVILEEEVQSVVEKSSKDDNNGGEIAEVDGEETELPQGIDNAEDFAFDLEGENFVESLHLGQEEMVRTSQGETGVSSPSSFGQPERVSSPRRNPGESGNKDAMVDSIDLTNDDEEEEAGIVKSVVIDEIDLTDNEEIDLTDDEDVTEDVGPSAGKRSSVSVTPRIEVHHLAEGANGPTSISQDMVNGDGFPEETRVLPVIEGCSRSFIEDLAAAPSAEIWSDGELDMAQENCNEPAFLADQPAAQILNARSITLEEFCSPAPITPMPPYDEMVTPQLAMTKPQPSPLPQSMERLMAKNWECTLIQQMGM
ncbi:Structure-specific endonuclease subunit SLX4 [Holothuria leucospilota]|uniref:Structure-specific endonuclease subunit SLX4 n=1 Tax=Holothuria leucospilota TaxID=206669 RepID=A0A9Q1BLM0_HOLLE|nr:Structure-specific endonuclease subunit SLX4 [Holothuria leucospilota]